MFIAPADQMLLQLAIIDVAPLRSVRPTVPHAKPAVRRSTGAIGAVGANIVRLIPGVTRLPLGLPGR